MASYRVSKIVSVFAQLTNFVSPGQKKRDEGGKEEGQREEKELRDAGAVVVFLL